MRMARVTCANHNTPGRDRGGTNFEALGNMKNPAGRLQTSGGEKVVKQGITGRYQRSVLPALQRDYSTIPEREERLKAIARTHNFWLFTATADEINRGYGSGPEGLPVKTENAFRDLMRAGGSYGDPIPVTHMNTFDAVKPIVGICLNEDVLQKRTIAAVKWIFKEVHESGEKIIDLVGMIDEDQKLEKVYEAITNDPGDPHGLVWRRLRIWEKDNNNNARYWANRIYRSRNGLA